MGLIVLDIVRRVYVVTACGLGVEHSSKYLRGCIAVSDHDSRSGAVPGQVYACISLAGRIGKHQH